MDEQQPTKTRRTLTGVVVSDKMDKTITVEVTRLVQHPTFRKYVSRSKTYKAHDAENVCKMDDMVVIQESRPLSATKRWMVIEQDLSPRFELKIVRLEQFMLRNTNTRQQTLDRLYLSRRLRHNHASGTFACRKPFIITFSIGTRWAFFAAVVVSGAWHFS